MGSLSGYREADGKVRMILPYLRGDEAYASLSTKVAEQLSGKELRGLPEKRLLRFLPPDREPAPVVGWPLSYSATEDFSGRFVFVGAAGNDSHETAFGKVAGVRIHAWAAHALRTASFLRRTDYRWTLLSLFGAFYVLTLVQAHGGGRRDLIVSAAALSLGFIAATVVAARFGRMWVDISYPLIGIWILTGLLSGGAVLQAGRRRVDSKEPLIVEAAGGGVGPSDVFLSHNSKNKPLVRELADALQARELAVWLDEWELVPGRSWQEELETAISTTRSAAVLVGAQGLGPWEIPEMRACISECVDRGMPVIPVLLPGASRAPDLPLFLRSFTWVDLRKGLSEKGLDRLQWGITGVKPKRAR